MKFLSNAMSLRLLLAAVLLFLSGCADKQTYKVVPVKLVDPATAPATTLSPVKMPDAMISVSVESGKGELQPDKRARTETKAKTAVNGKSPAEVKAEAEAAFLAESAVEAERKTAVIKESEEAYNELVRASPYVAVLSPGWDCNAFKYLSIDGDRYSYEVIRSYIDDTNNDSLLGLGLDKELFIVLPENFELAIEFHPPKTAGHENFTPFNIKIVNTDGDVVVKEKINNRVQTYFFSR